MSKTIGVLLQRSYYFVRILAEEETSSEPADAVIFFGLSLVLGIACRNVLRGTRVPYTVALLVIGIALGSLEYGTHHQLGKLGDSIRIWANIDPDLLLAVFLPALLYREFIFNGNAPDQEMYGTNASACWSRSIDLYILSWICSKLIFPYNWNWKTSLLLGALLSATDPVAVVALLKELGTSKKLSTIIEGESLMNDGTAIAVYQLFYRMVLGESSNAGMIFKFLPQVAFGAVGIGLAIGIASVLWLGFIFNDTVIEITLTVAVSYIAYFTVQEALNFSGVLAVMTLGMFYVAAARTAFKGEGQKSLHHFWEMVAYIANTLIFILSGVVIAESVLADDEIFHNQGLRGAVALSLSLSVKRTSDSSVYISSETGTLKRILNYTKYEMLNLLLVIWAMMRNLDLLTGLLLNDISQA